MAAVSRTDVFYDFNQFAQLKDKRSMDEICKVSNGFNLQVQQQFLADYISKKNSEWRSLLLYHQIGSGKTCTAITLAEQYMTMHKEARVTVILPARLRTNFIDELVSPCGMERYISADDFAKYHNSGTSSHVKAAIRRQFMADIEAKYDIMSFEKFRDLAFKAKDFGAWVKDFTRDRLIIIDEVHNLLSDSYDEKKYKEFLEAKRIQKAKGTNTILFKLVNALADKSCRMLLLTATPVFDNIAQFREVVTALAPDTVLNSKDKISTVIDKLRGKVSFFPGTSANAYPSMSYITHEVPLSKVQDHIINYIIESNADEGNPLKEAFLSKQRMAGIACFPNKKTIAENIPKIVAKIDMFAPKVAALVKNIEQVKAGKHVVYSTFIDNSLRLIEAALRARGWVSISEVHKNADLWAKNQYKVYALWDGTAKDVDKQLIKSVVNNPVDNLDGRRLKVILGSPSIKEGVSFKHVQHLHIVDPVWNSSAKDQVEGRAIRFCSHVDINKDHPVLKRHVNVHIYKGVPRPGGLVQKTSDQEIYDRIIPAKQKLIVSAERALKKVAIDYYLFRNMYHKTNSGKDRVLSPPPKKAIGDKSSSAVSMAGIEDVRLAKTQLIKMKRRTCPKPRRPNDVTGLCPDGMEKRPNTHGEQCCYKDKKQPKVVAANTAPAITGAKGCSKDRVPVNGKCQDGFYLKANKHGIMCCYKRRG